MKKSTDELLDLVHDRRRRSVLLRLRQDSEESLDFDELVDAIHANAPGEGSPDSREIAVDLHHRHLPMLAAADVVQYDYDAGTVRYVPDPRVEDVLDRVTETE